MTAQPPRPVVPDYPDPETHRRRWRKLAREIAAREAEVTDDPQHLTPPNEPGTLEILGSGIEATGFSRADEARIRAADDVFFCVADPATKVWLMSERPDAFDLYVLYDDSKRRYLTYMQMTEAMLHAVRQGRHVVAVFYGHPGVFVLATHRAVLIARREGHTAVMRPAVSALDALCADLGVDPSQPGMQMYEATDMLIRSRQPDPGLHLVLWQVGLIGELGYRRQGYLNTNFAVLLNYLEAIYGARHPVINYVGSRYPGIDPLIQPTSIEALRDPLAQSWVTGISTFYIPPKDPGITSPEMLERLGLIRPGQPVNTSTDPMRIIDRYGARERRAFADFAGFDVPASYQWQHDTPASRFILALCDDASVRAAYQANPEDTVAAWPGLSAKDRGLLARRDPGALQLAAKGAKVLSAPGNRKALNHLLLHKSSTAALLRAVTSAPRGEARSAAATWALGAGLSIDWPALSAELAALTQSSLPVWSGLYLDNGRRTSLSVFGRTTGSGMRADLDGVRIKGLRFHKGTLIWEADAGNTTSGYLQADMTPNGTRRFTGLIWPAGHVAGSEDGQHRVCLNEHVVRAGLPACFAVGEYRTQTGPLVIAPDPDSPNGVSAQTNSVPLTRMVEVTAGTVSVGDMHMPVADKQVSDAAAWTGHEFRLCLIQGSNADVISMQLAEGRARVNDTALHGSVQGDVLTWQDGPDALANGTLTFTLDPITLVPLLHGTGQTASGTKVALRGMAVINAENAARLVRTPRLGLPDWAWAPLVGLMADLSQRGGLFLWHGQDRARVNLMRVRKTLAILRSDEVEDI